MAIPAAMKTVLSLLLRFLVISVFLYLLFRGTDFEALKEAFRVSDVRLWTVGALLQVVANVLCPTARWKLMLARDEIKLGYAKLMVITLESAFFTVFLPSSIGGDVFRGASIYKEMQRVSGAGVRRTVVNLLGERTMGLWGICLIALCGLVLPAPGYGKIKFWALAACVLVFAASVSIVWKPLVELANRIFRLFSERVANVHAEATKQFGVYLSDRRLFSKILGWSFVQNMVGVFAAYIICNAAGAELGFLFFLITMPVIWLLSLMPTFAGIGPKEAGLVFMMMEAGIVKETAVASSVMLTASLLAISVLGGLVYLGHRHRPETASPR